MQSGREGIISIMSNKHSKQVEKEARPESVLNLCMLLLQTALLAPLHSCQCPSWNGYTVSCLRRTDLRSINFPFASFFENPEKLPYSFITLSCAMLNCMARQVKEEADEPLQSALLGDKALQTTGSDLIPPGCLSKEKV